jgi:hypothetical protein
VLCAGKPLGATLDCRRLVKTVKFPSRDQRRLSVLSVVAAEIKQSIPVPCLRIRRFCEIAQVAETKEDTNWNERDWRCAAAAVREVGSFFQIFLSIVTGLPFTSSRSSLSLARRLHSKKGPPLIIDFPEHFMGHYRPFSTLFPPLRQCFLGFSFFQYQFFGRGTGF